jgi:hypothetical protein
MARFVFVVFTAPNEGQEDEYNEWYDRQHLADVGHIPGMVSAERLVLADMAPAQTRLPKYLALYEIETDDVSDIPRAIAEAQAAGRMPSSGALDRSAIRSAYYQPMAVPREAG